jgi:hypothetical protein
MTAEENYLQLPEWMEKNRLPGTGKSPLAGVPISW